MPVRFPAASYKSKLAISGETGSGKSTLLKIIAGLVNPDSGNVYFSGERIKRVPEEKLIPGHLGIAYLSQHFELPNHLRIEQVLAYASELSEERATDVFRICRIDSFLKRKTNELSGGEKQRVALAKLLVSSPRLLLLDEPFSNLDLSLKSTLKDVVEDLSRELGITSILVSHDPSDVLSWADEILVLQSGRVVQKQITFSVYNQPVNEYVAGLLGYYSMITDVSGARSMVRPEWILIDKESKTKKAQILGTKYFGSYTDLMLDTPDGKLLARVCDHNFKAGELVTFSIERSWSFPE